MKTIILGLMTLGLATTVLAIEPTELDTRIRTLTSKFEAMQRKPDKRIPAETLAKAKGIILMDRTKAGFIFAYEGGGGVAMVKDSQTGKWSPAAFVDANEASLGFQIGGEQNFFVILLMTTNSIRMLTDSTFEFGGEARGTAGDSTAGAQGTVAAPDQPILVYDDRKGLYGGAAIKGNAITPDETANRVYYKQYVTMEEILFKNKVQPTDAETQLVGKINEYSKPPAASSNAAK